jgi:hypothetical protein
MVFDVASGAIGGAVAAVVSPVVFAWVKNKIVAPLEKEIAVLKAAAASVEKKI